MCNQLKTPASAKGPGRAPGRAARLAVIAAMVLFGLAAWPPAPRMVSASPPDPTFTVNYSADIPADLTDTVYTVCRTAANNNICTLRAAVMKANRFAGSGATIIIPSGAYTLTIAPRQRHLRRPVYHSNGDDRRGRVGQYPD